tara:strand:+ start:1433 stop:1705 length:273 start_codon:yes stop_codon:yes gene_type:complete
MAKRKMGPQSYEDFFSSQSKMGKLREVQTLRYYEEAVKKINSFPTPPPQAKLEIPKGFGSDKKKDGTSDKFVKFIIDRISKDDRLKKFRP